MLLLLISLTAFAQSPPFVTVLVLNDTIEASGRFTGYLMLIGEGRVPRGSVLGIPVPKGEYEWQIPNLLPAYKQGVLYARFYSTDKAASPKPIRCSLPFAAGTATFFLHFAATPVGYACTLTP